MISIGPAAAADVDAIAELHVRTWREAYRGILPAAVLAALSIERRAAMWRELLARGTPEILVARLNNQIIGFASFGASRDEDAAAGTAEIEAIYVDARHWSSGAGRALWLAVLARLTAQQYRRVTLWVLAQNARAIRFYEAAGFAAEPAAIKKINLGGAVVDEVRYWRHIVS